MPSTRSEAMPNPWPRVAKVDESPRAKPWNVEIAHWLLTMFKMTGAWYVEAKTIAEWKSDSAVAPSPIHAEAIRVSPDRADAIAHPTA